MEIPRHWRLRAQRYRQEGSVCPICGQHTFPPRRVCPYCAGQLVPIDGYGLSVLLASNKVLAYIALFEMVLNTIENMSYRLPPELMRGINPTGGCG